MLTLELKEELVSLESMDIAEENVRFEEPLQEDRQLQRNIRSQGLLQDIVGRWEGDRFKVIIGRSRLNALRALGIKEIKAKVTELKGYEAVTASLSENALKRDIDPSTRAKAVARLIEMNPDGLAGVASDLGIAKSTLSEWRRILDLEPELLETVKKGDMSFRVALRIAKSDMDPEQQKWMARQIEERGPDAMKSLARELGVEKRGAPRGILSARFTFEQDEKTLYDFAETEATRLGVDLGRYIKEVALDGPSLKERMKATREG